MSKALTITIHPSPLDGEYLTVSDAMRQVLDFVEALEQAEASEGGARRIVWRLTKAHTNSPPFTVVAEAFPTHPSMSVALEANRIASFVTKGVDELLHGRVPAWIDDETAKPLRRMLERNLNGVSRTELALGDDPQIDVVSRSARAAVTALERFALDKQANKPDYSRTEFGCVECDVVGLSRYNRKPALLAVERLSEERFTCVLSDDLVARIGPTHSWIEAWDGRRLLVTGELFYNSDDVLKRANITDLEERPFTDVSASRLKSIDLLGGRTLSEHLKILRGG